MIVVTGGAGFVGSNLVHAIGEQSHGEVIVVDHLADQRKFSNLVGAAVEDYLDRDDFLELVCSDSPLLADVSLVIHQGACSSTTHPDGRHVMAVNHDYTKHVVRWCLRHQVPLVYTSSAAVYGAGSSFAEEPTNERPVNVYGWSKLLVDRFVRRSLPAASSQVVGLRYFNVYGMREDHKDGMASIAAQLDNQVRASGTATIFGASHGVGDGQQRRDFVSVDDVIDVVLWFADHPNRSGVFNVGTGDSWTFGEVAEAVIAHRGAGEVRYREFHPELVGRYQASTRADLTRLHAAGYDGEFTPMPVGVARYLRTGRVTGALPRIVRHVIVDRDGVLNVEGTAPLSGVDGWVWERGARDGLSALARAGIAVSVATNQSAVGAGILTATALDEVHRWLTSELEGLGVRVVGVFACLHVAADGCNCRKPAPGLIEAAIGRSGVAAEETLLIGDDHRDLLAADAAGVAAVLVRTGKGASVEPRVSPPTAVFDDLAAAVRAISGSRVPGTS